MTASNQFEGLPFLDQYLRDILRPRVERAVDIVAGSLEEAVLERVVQVLAAEQPSGGAETPDMIRRLVREKLGMRFEVKVSAVFGAPQPAARMEPAAKPQVVVRSTSMPLVSAVIADAKKGSGR
jgi:cell division ATPase FtsA